ncbi:MAG TPA: hypothetical protein VFN09_03585 [Rhodanobacteraceae bacterium]|nr:hypothetical protein [Rhodanobacteraceae bacterium]
MKRTLNCLVFAACTLLAVNAFASNSATELEVDTSASSAAVTRDSGSVGDAGALTGGSRGADLGGVNSRARSSDSLESMTDGNTAAPRKSHSRSWQSLLPGSIQ